LKRGSNTGSIKLCVRAKIDCRKTDVAD